MIAAVFYHHSSLDGMHAGEFPQLLQHNEGNDCVRPNTKPLRPEALIKPGDPLRPKSLPCAVEAVFIPVCVRCGREGG